MFKLRDQLYAVNEVQAINLCEDNTELLGMVCKVNSQGIDLSELEIRERERTILFSAGENNADQQDSSLMA